MSPLVEGFRKGIKTPPENFDTVTKVSMTDSAPSIESIADRYGVSVRTAYRWRHAGVDITDPVAVAEHLLRMRTPSPSALRSAEQALHLAINSKK